MELLSGRSASCCPPAVVSASLFLACLLWLLSLHATQPTTHDAPLSQQSKHGGSLGKINRARPAAENRARARRCGWACEREKRGRRRRAAEGLRARRCGTSGGTPGVRRRHERYGGIGTAGQGARNKRRGWERAAGARRGRWEGGGHSVMVQGKARRKRIGLDKGGEGWGWIKGAGGGVVPAPTARRQRPWPARVGAWFITCLGWVWLGLAGAVARGRAVHCARPCLGRLPLPAAHLAAAAAGAVAGSEALHKLTASSAAGAAAGQVWRARDLTKGTLRG